VGTQGVKGVADRSALGAIPLCGRVRFSAATVPATVPATSNATGLDAIPLIPLIPLIPQDYTHKPAAQAARKEVGAVEAALHDRLWLFAGLGSRGLIHHSVLGHSLAQAIVHGDDNHIPAPARPELTILPS